MTASTPEERPSGREKQGVVRPGLTPPEASPDPQKTASADPFDHVVQRAADVAKPESPSH